LNEEYTVLPTGLAGAAFFTSGVAAGLPKMDAKMSCFFSGAFSTLAGAATGLTGAEKQIELAGEVIQSMVSRNDPSAIKLA